MYIHTKFFYYFGVSKSGVTIHRVYLPICFIVQDCVKRVVEGFFRDVIERTKIHGHFFISRVFQIHVLITKQRDSYQGDPKVNSFLRTHQTAVRYERFHIFMLWNWKREIFLFRLNIPCFQQQFENEVSSLVTKYAFLDTFFSSLTFSPRYHWWALEFNRNIYVYMTT